MSQTSECATTFSSAPQCSPKPSGRAHEPSWAHAVETLRRSVANWTFRSGELLRLRSPVARADLLGWLHRNPGAPRCYWSDRDGAFSMAGIGTAWRLEAHRPSEFPALLEHIHALAAAEDDVALFCGFAFDEASGFEQWSGFPAALALLPALELRNDGQNFALAVNLYADSPTAFRRQQAWLCKQLDGLQPPSPCQDQGGIDVVQRIDHFDFPTCQAHIAEILSAIERGCVHKAVLARPVELHFDQPLAAFPTLSRWQQISAGSFGFALEHGHHIFMGCSPERLFRRVGHCVQTESLAGTVRRGNTPEEDRLLEGSLRRDPKLIREHAWVTRYIEGELAPWVDTTDAPDEAGVLKLDRIQHRHLPIRATLNAGVGDLQLLRALHPTPAVCGFPRRRAHELIRRVEQAQRGWYSGVVGVVGAQTTEFAVAIRSALIDGDRAWCYSGVGIVEGSEANAEWLELEAKIESFLAAVKG